MRYCYPKDELGSYPFCLILSTGRMSDHLNVPEIGTSAPTRPVQVGPRVRSCYLLHLVTKGRVFFNGQPVSAGHGFLICPGVLHEFHSLPGETFEHLWVALDGSDAQAALLQIGFHAVQPQVFPFRDSDTLHKNLQRYFSSDNMEADKPAIMMSILYYLLSVCAHPVAATPARVQMQYVSQTAQLIETNFALPVSIKQLASAVGLSGKYLCRIFHEQMGYSPKAYLTHVRLTHARELLCNSNLPVRVVSRSVGYEDALQFSQIYRKHFGCTPSEERAYIQK